MWVYSLETHAHASNVEEDNGCAGTGVPSPCPAFSKSASLSLSPPPTHLQNIDTYSARVQKRKRRTSCLRRFDGDTKGKFLLRELRLSTEMKPCGRDADLEKASNGRGCEPGFSNLSKRWKACVPGDCP